MGPSSCPRHASTTTAGQHRPLFPARPAAAVVGSPLDLSPLIVPTEASLEQRAPLGSAITISMCQRQLCHQVSGFSTA